MAYFTRNNGSFSVDPAILANTGAEINVANRNANITDTYIGLNAENAFAVPAGLFVATVNGVDRFLPRTKNSTLITATSSTSFTASPYNIFVTGDVLHLLEPHVILTITGATVGQTQTITVAGLTATATATTTNTTTTATEVVAAVNARAGLNQLVYALNVANAVYIFAKDGTSLLGVTEGGTVTATLNAATMAYNDTAVGTISHIIPATGVIHLTAAAGVTVPIGANLGVRGVSEIKGLHIHAVDFTVIKSRPLSLYSVASAVRTQFLPYFDGNIEATFPKMLFGTTF